MAAEPLLSTGEKETEKVRFGNFEVMNDPEGRPILLGKGTFGRTYQARHCFLDIIVALKIITERYVADPTVRQRFLTEARAVAKLSHPHIARLYDFGEKEGVLHYAMEYCGGGSLADHVAKNGPLPLRRTIEIAQQISGALKCAHTAGFIHRDLKPSNIMLTAQDGPLFAKLIDFGLVQPSVPGATRSFAEDQSADGARFLGTPLFASPEQLREEPMDVRTDLFSLGMTLWFLMAGRAPESGSSAEIAASRLNRESYAARLPANLPPPFRDVLVRLLEKDRRNRFTTAADLFNSLNARAAALGFRQAKDYTEPLAAIDSEDAQATESGALAKLEPIEIEEVTAPLTSEFSIVTRINEDFTGINYVASEVEKKGAMSILHVLHPTLLEDEPALDRFRVHIAQLMRVDVTEIVRPKAIKRYSDYVAVISDKPEGTDLLSVLRTEGTVPLVEAAPLLEKIADVCDRLCAARLPGVQLAPGRIYVERPNGGLSKVQVRLCPRFLTVSEATELARMNEPEETSSTMTTDMLGDPARADNMAEHFASLLYRVVAGRNCPVAASISTQAYVAVPGLSEQSNRILALVIARQVEDSSCGKVLREVLNAEGIVHRVPGHPSAGFTERPGSSTVSPVTGVTQRLEVASPETRRRAKRDAGDRPSKSGSLIGAVVILLVVTIGAWYFGLYKPSQKRRSEVSPAPQAQTSPSVPQKASPPPIESASASSRTESPGHIEGIPDGSLFGISELAATETPDPNAETNLTLRIGVMKRRDQKIDPNKVKIGVFFYDTVDNKDVKLTNADVNYVWFGPHDWQQTNLENLTVRYVREKGKNRPLGAGHRNYLGYIVRVDYDNKLQDLRGDPTRLLTLFSTPPTASAPNPVQGNSAVIAPTSAVAPEPAVRRQSSYMSWTDRLTQFASDYVDSTGDSNVERAVSFYAPTADILDEGPKSLDQIRQEIVNYNERWPLRRNSIVGGIHVQEHVRDESYTIGFDQNFYVESAARREWSRGKVAVTLEVRIQGGVPEITSLKQRTLERQKGVLSAAR
jgi:serine/threonine protein kinase